MTAPSRSRLRAELRRQRRALSPGQRRAASRALLPNLLAALPLRKPHSVALYMPVAGELDPLPLLRHSRFRHSHCYLPVLDRLRRGRLRFRYWQTRLGMASNQYGIAEPLGKRRQRALWALDLLIIPAVGFDREGNRLGMGGGYYDRTLADLQRRPRRPLLVVVGYQFQCLAPGQLPVAPWDQPVDRVVTDSSWW